jgi:hypothetical protein
MEARHKSAVWFAAVRHFAGVLCFVFVSFLPVMAGADTQITLKNSFIEKYKNRATITATYNIDAAHKRPNPASKDGDMHIAGRAPEVGLPIVAEIMNASSEKTAVDKVHEVEGTGQPIQITGAWRLWTEHGGDSVQTQGVTLKTFTTSNPEHVFEIHPVTKLGAISVADSWRPIEGFETKDADQAFHRYESTRSRIIPGKSTTTMVTTMAGYNYVEFLIELNEEPKPVADGAIVMASILDLDGQLLVRNRRMVFIAGTPPDAAAKHLKQGDCLHVLGIPRIDLALVSWRAKNAAKRPGALTWNLPYEMIMAGVYDDNACANR